tara:strand:+ start:33 stop:332 length:300 start_codon:yes stop_codon:yes gene_type:complete
MTLDNNELMEIQEHLITNFLVDFLDNDPDYHLLTQEEQDNAFRVYKIILVAVHKAASYDNVYPVVFANDAQSKKFIDEAINKLSEIVPDVKKVTVSLVH